MPVPFHSATAAPRALLPMSDSRPDKPSSPAGRAGKQEATTHFGYQTVATGEKAKKVAEVFHSVAARYDVMNDLMSFGVHRLWKRYTIEMAGVRPGQQVLDIAGGTGDLAKAFSKRVGPTGKVILSDINASMLGGGRDRLIDNGLTQNLEFVQANAECLPFADNTFDLLTISFF